MRGWWRYFFVWINKKTNFHLSSSNHPSDDVTQFLISSVCFTSQCKYVCVCVRMCVYVCVCERVCFGGRWAGLVCVCVWDSSDKTGQTFGVFHSILKHAEHRTLNTDTEQLSFYPNAVSLFLSIFSCLFFLVCFCLFFVQSGFLGYTEHDGTNRTRLDILL